MRQFGRELDRNGLKVSVPELLDALRAASVVGVEDRDSLRSALSCSLCKRSRDRAVFDSIFDSRFPARSWIGEKLLWLGKGAEAGGAALEELVKADLISSGQTARLSALALFAMTGEGADLLLQILSACTRDADFSGGGPECDGLMTARLLEAVSWEPAEAEIGEALAALDGRFPGDFLRLYRQKTMQRLELAARAVRELVSDRKIKPAGLAGIPLVDREIGTLTPQELETLKIAIHGLARKLEDRARKKRKLFSRGRLDTKKILRTSSATDGVPMRLSFRKRARGKPELIVLCDLSDSVRNVSALMLRFLHALHGLTLSLRSFVFVNEVGETTGLFRGRPVDEALSSVVSGEAVSLAGNSNYGRVFRSFLENFGGALGRRSTVLIIGDGRTNWLDPGLEPLDEIGRKAARVLWLTPEREIQWAYGDSAMALYRSRCDRVGVASNVTEMKAFVETLVL
jgi:uncharacterized protein with von Willebrand factor type A (vWA) domain